MSKKGSKKNATLEPLDSRRRWQELLQRAQQSVSRPSALPAALVILTVVIWARSFVVSMVGWDDTTYFFEDARLNELLPGNIWSILTEPFFANYHPGTTLTLAFDRAVWGTWVPGFHITQLVFYVGGVVALYFLFNRLLSSPFVAFVAASLYSMHTTHVESVAWLACRKDVVCLFFYASSILAYVSYANKDKSCWGLYVTSLSLTAAAMLSKGYAVALPAVFFAYDLCFKGRIGKREIVDKLPFVLIAVVVAVVTVLAQDEASALVNLEIPMWQRVGALLEVFTCYVGRALLPVRLSAMYVVDARLLNALTAALGVALAIGVVLGFIVLRRRLPAGAFSIALFVLPLGTVMNVFFTLRIWMADRYLFLPTVGSALALTTCGVWLFGRPQIVRSGCRWLIPMAASALVLLYAGLTVSRIGVWTDPVLLWSDTLRKQLDLGGSGPVFARELEAASVRTLPDSRPALWLVQSYKRQGNAGEADALMKLICSLRKSVASGDEIHLARLDIESGQYDNALKRLRPLAEGNTWLTPIALGWAGVAYENKGQLDAAIKAHVKALELYREDGRPGTPALLDLAGIEFRAQHYGKAAEWYRRARNEDPTDPRGVFFLGVSMERTGRVEEAYRLYGETLRMESQATPNIAFSFVDVHLQMGLASRKLGRLRESVSHYEEWLRRASGDRRQDLVRREIRELRVYMDGNGNGSTRLPQTPASVSSH